MKNSLENSLRRIRRDYLDVYQPHWPATDVNVDSILRVLEDFHTEGKVRFSGLSNFSTAHLSQTNISNFPALRFFQNEYNPVEKAIGDSLLDLIEFLDGALIAYSPFREGQIFKSQKV